MNEVELENLNIDTVFEYLMDNQSEEIQKIGIMHARKIRHLSVLIQPLESKSLWENCARVLVEKSDMELRRYLYSLFKWIQDMNWPGADLIFRRLVTFNEEDFQRVFEYSLALAEKTLDSGWSQPLMQLKIEHERYMHGQLHPCFF